MGWRRGGLVFKLSGLNWSGLCGLLVGSTGVGSGVGGDELLEQAEEGELALGGEGGLGFVEEVEAAGDHAGLEKAQETRAVGESAEVFAGAGGESLFLGKHVGAPARVGGEAFGQVVEGFGTLFLGAGESKKVLGAEEELKVGAGHPAEAEGVGEGAEGRERVVVFEGRAGGGGAFGLGGDGLEVAGAVFADEAGERRGEAEDAQVAQGGNGERINRGVGGRRLDGRCVGAGKSRRGARYHAKAGRRWSSRPRWTVASTSAGVTRVTTEATVWRLWRRWPAVKSRATKEAGRPTSSRP